MKIILAGGSGFLGTALARSLLAGGHSVWVLTRNPERAQVPQGAQAVGWDGRTPAGWGHLMEEADAVVNLVGENLGNWPWNAERKRRILSSRVNAGQALLEAVRQAAHRPSVLLQASGIGYYGLSGDRVVTEKDAPGTDFLAQVCVAWEGATRPVEELGVRWAATRNGLVLDARQSIFPLVLLPFRLFVGGPLGSGKQYFPWIHLDDQIQGMRFLLENEKASGAYNFVAPDLVTNAELGKAIAKAMRRPYYFPVPGYLLKLVLGDMSVLVLEGQRARPERLEQAGYQYRFPDLAGALRDMLR